MPGQQLLLLLREQDIAAEIQRPQLRQPFFVREQLLECLIVRRNADFLLVGKAFLPFEGGQRLDMMEKFKGVLIVQAVFHRQMLHAEIAERSRIILRFDHPPDALIGDFPADAVFVVGAQDKAAVAAVLGVELHDRLAGRAAAGKTVEHNLRVIHQGDQLPNKRRRFRETEAVQADFGNFLFGVVVGKGVVGKGQRREQAFPVGDLHRVAAAGFFKDALA